MTRVLVLAILALIPATPLRAGQTSATPVRVGGSVQAPQRLKDVKPVIPAEWQRQGGSMEGVVTLDLTIDENGRVHDAVVTHSIPALDQAALDAVRQWQYEPPLVNGRPAPVIMTVMVSFPSQRVATLPVTGTQAIRLTSARTQDGVTMVWEIAPSRAAALPRANPETAELPLSAPAAVKSARTWLTQRNPGVQRFELQNVSISRVRRGTDIDFWYYQIDFFSYGLTPQPGGPLLEAVILPDGSVVEPTKSGGTTPPPNAYQPGPGVTMPRLLRDVRPNYTSEALQRKISGSVSVQGVVGVDGGFHNLRVVKSLDAVYGLDQAALDAAAQWQFVPGTKDGQPVPVMVTVEMTFTMKK
jgi:TonB family protein